MSELAYNLQGERFQPPDTASAWRVRRLKPGGRGTPDVVFGAEGAPLMLPLETEIGAFRQAVAAIPGRYRLDAVTENFCPCDGGQPAYLYITKQDEAPELAPAIQPANSNTQDDLLRELIRVNSEMVRNITDKFASVMDSAAGLIRAADGAGLPAREPTALANELAAAVRNAAPSPVESVYENDDDDDDEPEIETTPLSVAMGLLEQVTPYVGPLLASKFPGASAAVAATATESPPAEPVDTDPDAVAEPTPAKKTPPSSTNFMGQFLAVKSLLTKREFKFAQATLGNMPPALLADWKERLMAASPEDAAETIRAEIRRAEAKPAKTKAASNEEAA